MRLKIWLSLAAAVSALAATWTVSAADQAVGPQVSLSLQDALQLALSNNLNYQSALADVHTAEAKVIQAHSVRLPTLGVGYSYVHTQNAATFQVPVPQGSGPPALKAIQFSSKDTNNVNATLQYALYSGGSGQAAIGEAAANLAGAHSQLAATRNTVIRDTTTAYFALISAQRSALVADQAVSVAQKNLTTSQQLFQAGTAARADVLRQEVTLANARVQAIQAHNAAALDNAQLANLLNINLGSVITPTEPLEAQTPTFDLGDLLSKSQNRPELASAQDAVTIADYAVKIARSALLPQVSLTVQEASSKPNFVNVPQPQLSETLAATWQLFNGGLTRGRVKEASSQVDRAKVSLKQLSNGIDLEVRQAYFNFTAAKAQVAAALSAQTSAQEELRVSQIRYGAGVGTSLELSDALLSYTQAQNQYINALANLRQALVALQRAAGLL